MGGSIPYIPGHIHKNFGPVTRFLPPSSLGSTETWLKDNCDPGSWVLDPFGSSPHMAVEAAHAGYRVLVTANNPISRILIELFTKPATETDFQSALEELAMSLKGDERIENHIQSLYLTHCPRCLEEINADAYIWENGAATPSQKLYNCPFCKEIGESPVDQTDLDRVMKFKKSGLHWSRALERVVSFDDPNRLQIEKVLDVYLPRAVYTIITLINNIDRINPQNQPYLLPLLLSCFDQANKLWPSPASKNHPKNLNAPRQFYEYNLWSVLEASIPFWIHELELVNPGPIMIPISIWPQLPSGQSGICLYEGNIKDLIARTGNTIIKGESIKSVLATFPDPNRAYWTLSTLWSGWLWGRKAVTPFKGVLKRRRYGWAWHTKALNSITRNITNITQPNTPFFGSIGKADTRFITATLLAVYASEFDLSGIALRAEEDHAQFLWLRSQLSSQEFLSDSPTSDLEIKEVTRRSARKYLNERGEPTTFVSLFTASLVELLRSQKFSSFYQNFSLSDLYSQIHNNIKNAFTNQDQIVSYSKGDRSFETGFWWLSRSRSGPYSQKLSISLADRVEHTIIRYLREHKELVVQEFDKYICNNFRGLLTPDISLILECIKSYCQRASSEEAKWCLREQDLQEKRNMDIQNIQLLINQIGGNLGYDSVELDQRHPQKELFQVQDKPLLERPVIIEWKLNSEAKYIFYLISTGMIGNTVYFQKNHGSGIAIRKILIIPGGRASLVRYKINHDLRLKQATQLGWHFIKYRHVRLLSENEYLTSKNFFDQLSQDPLANTDPQMSLL